jgi:hypothetical protein
MNSLKVTGWKPRSATSSSGGISRTQKWVKDSTTSAEMKKFKAYVESFKKYAAEYNFDYLMLAA